MIDPLASLIAASIAFVGTHFAMSHPLRAPMVGVLGAGGFMIAYSLVSAATMAWMYFAFVATPAGAPLWGDFGDGVWIAASIVTLIAMVLFAGSLVGNPAMPDPDGAVRVPAQAKGVFAVTRHPMLWAFALWGLSHILVCPVAKNIIVALAILILSLVGAALQDRKKEWLQPAQWREWESKTSYWPFAAIVAGRARFGRFGAHALAGGVVVWLAATWAHMPLAGWAAGIWRWIG